ncbi:MAG TPA: tRNA (N6-threonylcarbamoyladenosine(37)-N6)-methyltransferase TrmO [Ktedonobacterales bacterium]
MSETEYALAPIGFLRSPLKQRADAPKQAREGAPNAWLDVSAAVAEGLEGIEVGQDLILITWLHQSDRATLRVRPRGDEARPMTGVFATRSPDRPNPLGLHRVTVLAIEGHSLNVGPIEAIDGTPVVDIKPALTRLCDS